MLMWVANNGWKRAPTLVLSGMTSKNAQPDRPPHAPAEDAARIGDALTRMRLLIGRRAIGRQAIANIAPGLEISHLDALSAMRHIEGEVTVGAIAEAMRIDPSRGSRLAADLVAQGVLRRDASQADGRRSLLVLTELGNRLFAEIRNVKRALLDRVLEDWDEQDLYLFSVLFERFVADLESTYAATDKGSGLQETNAAGVASDPLSA